MHTDSMRARLVFVDDSGAPHSVPLGSAGVTLGRSRENDVVFARNEGVSRHHAEITMDGDRYVLLDRGSSAGTYINGVPIQDQVLVDGDVIQLGAVAAPSLRFVDTMTLAEDTTEVAALADEPMTVMVPSDSLFLNPERLEFSLTDFKRSNVEMAERLRALYTITSKLLAIQSLPELCASVLEMVFDVLPADRGAVLMLEGTHELTPRAMRIRGNGEDDQHFRPSRTIAGKVSLENVAVLTLDASTDARFASGQSVMMQAIRSVICAPISSGDDIFGVVYLDTTVKKRTFSEADLEFLSAICRQVALAMEKLHLLDMQKKTFESMMRALAHSIDARDGITAGHSSRVAKYSQAIARYMNMTTSQCRIIGYAGLLHDDGKIGTREAVLCKPGALTPEEYEHIKEHPRHTFRILSSIHFSPEMADIPRMASSHHERLDGKGYPFGWKGDEIPLGGRIIAVADFFDALTVKRHYREPAPLPEVMGMLQKGRDEQFDGGVLDAFAQYFEKEYLPHHKRLAERKAAEQFVADETTNLGQRK